MENKTELTIGKAEIVVEHNDFYSFKELPSNKVEVYDLEIGNVTVKGIDITDIVDPNLIELELKKALIDQYNSATSDMVWSVIENKNPGA